MVSLSLGPLDFLIDSVLLPVSAGKPTVSFFLSRPLRTLHGTQSRMWSPRQGSLVQKTQGGWLCGTLWFKFSFSVPTGELLGHPLPPPPRIGFSTRGLANELGLPTSYQCSESLASGQVLPVCPPFCLLYFSGKLWGQMSWNMTPTLPLCGSY